MVREEPELRWQQWELRSIGKSEADLKASHKAEQPELSHL